MAVPAKRSAANLFDNPVFPDITVTVSSSSGVSKYYMHKAVLSQGSGWFYEKLTTTHRKAQDISVKCNDGPLFEFLLRSMYSGRFDSAAFNKLATGQQTQPIVMLIRFRFLAKQYTMASLSEFVFRDIYTELWEASPDQLRSAIQEAFKDNTERDTALRMEIVSLILACYGKFASDDEECCRLLKEYPIFAVDMAVALSKRNKSIHLTCRECACTFVIQSYNSKRWSCVPSILPSM